MAAKAACQKEFGSYKGVLQHFDMQSVKYTLGAKQGGTTPELTAGASPHQKQTSKQQNKQKKSSVEQNNLKQQQQHHQRNMYLLFFTSWWKWHRVIYFKVQTHVFSSA